MHEGFTVWFTGLPRSGKSTIASLVAARLKELGCKVEVLDGDVVRTNLSKGLGFRKEDRDTNIRRIGFVCQLLSRNGVVAIAAAISPYRAIRDEVRQSIGRFVEVYAKCSIEVCEERDYKGHYEMARRGELPNFTGVSDPYEEPLHPEVVCQTDMESPEESATKVLQRLVELQYLPQTLVEEGKTEASPVYLQEEEEQIKERLRSLGYLE
ncbi:MAG: adenylyl-sulfate kinase [Candidatus Tectimicrobiota bacterium]